MRCINPLFFRSGRRILTAAFILTFLMPPLLAEIYIRLFSPAGYMTPEILRKNSLEYLPADPVAIFPDKVQDLRGASHHDKFYINSKGYRGREFDFKKPPGTTRIVFYGGSTVFDVNVNEPDDWPHRVEALLRQKGLSKIEAINAGIPGLNSLNAVQYLLTEGFWLQPDYVVLSCTWNDMKYFSYTKPLLHQGLLLEPIRPNPLLYYENFLDQWLCEISQFYVRLRYRYFAWKERVTLDGRKPEGPLVRKINPKMLRQYRLSLQAFADVARSMGAVPVFMTEARLVWKKNSPEERKKIHYEYTLLTPKAVERAYQLGDQVMREVSAEKKVPLLNVSASLTGQNRFYTNHTHLSREGSEAVAQFTPMRSKHSCGQPKPNSFNFIIPDGRRGLNASAFGP